MSHAGRSEEFDFERWARLAREDPDAFEAARQAEIEAFIGQAPQRLKARLQGLQWRLDAVRRQSGTPLAACLRMYSMMWDSVLGDGGLLEQLERLGRPEPPPRRIPGRLLPFRTPHPRAPAGKI